MKKLCRDCDGENLAYYARVHVKSGEVYETTDGEELYCGDCDTDVQWYKEVPLISKAAFDRVEYLRQSGRVNMFDTDAVAHLCAITFEEAQYVRDNYKELYDHYCQANPQELS